MIVSGADIIAVRHPSWTLMRRHWDKWRFIYRGGDEFNEKYIKKYSNLEDATDFAARKEISPSPCFAKSVVNEVKNSIFQRMGEISRKNGPDSYRKAVVGEGYGVDLHGSDMGTFLGRAVLPEMLAMAKVGVWVDMPPLTGPSLYDKKGKEPYLYVYKAEEILSWAYRKDRIEEFQAVLLVDYVDALDTAIGLPSGQWKRHRLCWIDDNGDVLCQMYNWEGVQIDLEGNPTDQPFKLGLPYIPFIVLELTDSLLADVSNHQIALLNLESADMSYALKSNFPVLVEQTDPREYSQYLKAEGGGSDAATPADVATRAEKNVRLGASVGRQYALGMNAPAFINPSPEPVTISMAKQAQLKEDIRSLINLSLSSIKPKMASADSKALDMQGLESGLAYIGLELQRGERAIAKIWGDYEGQTPATVVYPTKWSIESDDDRRKAVEQLEDLRDTVPSKTFQKLISSKMVKRLLGDEISVETRDKIDSEINAAESITADPKTIIDAVTAGVCDLELAAVTMGFPKTAPAKAAAEHAERLARIAASQSPGPDAGVANAAARGVGDQSATPVQDAAAEKAASTDTTKQGTPTDNTRGQGK